MKRTADPTAPRTHLVPDDWPDDLEPPSAEEMAEAEALARALDGRGPKGPAAFAEALRAAYRPADLAAPVNDALAEKALSKPAKRRQSGVLVRVSFGTSALIATAAAAALVLRPHGAGPVPTASSRGPVTFAECRSTQALFDEPFAPLGGDSARLARIATARERDLRENHFARWGVR